MQRERYPPRIFISLPKVKWLTQHLLCAEIVFTRLSHLWRCENGDTDAHRSSHVSRGNLSSRYHTHTRDSITHGYSCVQPTLLQTILPQPSTSASRSKNAQTYFLRFCEGRSIFLIAQKKFFVNSLKIARTEPGSAFFASIVTENNTWVSSNFLNKIITRYQ